MTEQFEKAEIVVMFGGGTIDMSEVKTTHTQVSLELVSIFGELKVKLPKDWAVTSEGVGIAGSFDTHAGNTSAKTTAHIKGAAIFATVEVI